jgi:organic anion transporter 4A
VGAVSVIFVCYFAGKTHKPRFVGVFVLIMAIGALLIASPQFIFGSYIISDNSSYTFEQCLDSTAYPTESCSTINAGAYALMIIGQALIGLGASPVYTVIPAYLDEIVPPRYIGIYLAVFLTSTVLGPVLGFAIASAALSVYVDPWIETTLDPEDPNFIGAWWIGYVVMGILLILLAIPYLMFPRYLKDTHLVKAERAKELIKVYSSKYANEDNLTIIAKMFPIHIKRLLLNPSFMLMSFGLAMAFLMKDGLVGFGPKYTEVIFRLDPVISGLLAGGVGITAAVIGTATGGIIIFLFKLKGRHASAMLWIIVLCCLPATALYFLRCPPANVAGVLHPYADGSTVGIDNSTCASECNCTSTLYQPVCGADAITYFSACRAGCASTITETGVSRILLDFVSK